MYAGISTVHFILISFSLSYHWFSDCKNRTRLFYMSIECDKCEKNRMCVEPWILPPLYLYRTDTTAEIETEIESEDDNEMSEMMTNVSTPINEIQECYHLAKCVWVKVCVCVCVWLKSIWSIYWHVLYGRFTSPHCVPSACTSITRTPIFQLKSTRLKQFVSHRHTNTHSHTEWDWSKWRVSRRESIIRGTCYGHWCANINRINDEHGPIKSQQLRKR